MDHPVYNPPIPYTGYICGGFRSGRILRIQGKVNPAAISFSINLQCGPSTSLSDIALHLNPRITESTVVRNSRSYSSWGMEERIRGIPFPFVRGQNFEVIVICEDQQFKISINGQHFADYSHRIPVERVSNISIDGDVSVTLIQFAGTSQPNPGVTTYSPPYPTANDSRMSPMNFVPTYPQESNSPAPVHYPPSAYSPPTGPPSGYGNQAPAPYLQQAGGFQQLVGCPQQPSGVYSVQGTGLLQGYQSSQLNKTSSGLLDNVGKLIAGGLAAVGLTKGNAEKKRGRPPNPENVDANGQKIAKRKKNEMHQMHHHENHNMMHTIDHFQSSSISECASSTSSPGPSSSMLSNGSNCLNMANPEFWQKHHQDPTAQKPKRKPRTPKSPKVPRVPRNKISKKLEQKQRRCKGESYISRSTKKLVEARKIKASTCINCPNNCKRWTEVERKMIFEHFWGIADDTRQKDWILAHVKLVQVKRKRTTSDRRNFSYKYYLPRGVEGDMAVCKKFFLSTLGYGEGALNYALRNAGKTRRTKKAGPELSGIDQLLGVPTAASLSGPSAAAVLRGITAAAALSNIAAEAARSASAKTLAKKSSAASEHNSASSVTSENSNCATLTEESAVEAISAAAAALIRIPYVEKVQLFLRTIPVLAAHNCRSSSNQMFFHTEVGDFDTLFRMYRRHCEENRIEKVSKVTFNRVVSNFDVKIHQPKKDRCSICAKYAAMPKPLERYKRHIRDQQITKDVLLVDRKSSGSKGSLTASLDIQKVIPSPNGDSPEFFCSRKHHTHNLTIFESKTRIVTCYLWGETEGNMTGIEMSTCLHKWLKTKDTSGKYSSIILNMHDVPGGLNGNKMLYCMLYYFVNNSKWINKIEIKFYLAGHKYVPSESPHAAVEKNLRRSKTFSYTEWPALIRNSRSRCSDYNVHRLLYDDFEDWNYEMNNRIMFAKSHTRGEWIKWIDIRYIRIEKAMESEFVINYNLNAPMLPNPPVKYGHRKKALPPSPKKKIQQKIQVFPRRRGRPRKVRIPVPEEEVEAPSNKNVNEEAEEISSKEINLEDKEEISKETDAPAEDKVDEEDCKGVTTSTVQNCVTAEVELIDTPVELIGKEEEEEVATHLISATLEIVIGATEGDSEKVVVKEEKQEVSPKKERLPKPPLESPDLTVKIFGPTLEKAIVNFEIKKAYNSPLPISYEKYKDLKDLCENGIIPKEFHAEFINLPHSEFITDRLHEADIIESDEESDTED